ncbi:MAG: glycogen-binding domain-containing protein [Treponema sp.]|jgi:hypothetical protein|nr:glycogen-binding domain-containing protein [Treponema sp.]
MKAFISTVFLVFIIGTIGALNTESYHFINHLVNLTSAGQPEVFEDGVLWTAPASYKRVGIAFAHEGFAKVYWFKKLMAPDDSPKPQKQESKQGPPVTYKDSGILFFTYTVPKELTTLEYRLIIDGLWTADPANPNKRISESGITVSIAPLPSVKNEPLTTTDTAPSGGVFFSYKGQSGQSVYVAGSFNNWDPFMYELKENSPGNYSLALRLPTGVYHYVFFVQGKRVLDYNGLPKLYRDGFPVNQLEVK